MKDGTRTHTVLDGSGQVLGIYKSVTSTESRNIEREKKNSKTFVRRFDNLNHLGVCLRRVFVPTGLLFAYLLRVVIINGRGLRGSGS